jgi:hypothetical protein
MYKHIVSILTFALVNPAFGQETCSVGYLAKAQIASGIGFEVGQAAEVFSEALGCRVETNLPARIYSQGGEYLGEVLGPYTALAQPASYQEPTGEVYWVWRDAQNKRTLAVNADAVKTSFDEDGWGEFIVDATEDIAEYNPETPTSGLALFGPTESTLQAQMRDYTAFATFNSIGVDPSNTWSVVLKSEPSGAEVWVAEAFHKTTERRVVLSSGEIEQVKLRMSGYQECGRDRFTVIDAGYGNKTLFCELLPTAE